MKTKYKTLKGLAFILFLAVSIPCLAMAQSEKYEAVLGTWDVETDGASYTFVFEFKMEGDSLIGSYIGSSGDQIPMEDLTYENNELIFSVNVRMGSQAMLIDYTAKVDEDELSGELSMEYGTAAITGVRRKK